MLLLVVVTGTLGALWRWPVMGCLGVWFFAILAPSSSFVPLTSQTIAEHRMYLSLAAVVVLVVAAGYHAGAAIAPCRSGLRWPESSAGRPCCATRIIAMP